MILAAGQSSRMRGRDKLLEDVGGKPLLQRIATRALATSHPTYVALPHTGHPRQAVLPDDIIPLIVPEAAHGMASCLAGTVKRLPACDALMLLLGDMPDLTTLDMNAIWNARAANPDHLIWRAATSNGRPGHPSIFDASLRAEFAKLSGDGGGETLVNPLRSQTHLTFFDDDRARRDLDTPEDWQEWRTAQTKSGAAPSDP